MNSLVPQTAVDRFLATDRFRDLHRVKEAPSSEVSRYLRTQGVQFPVKAMRHQRRTVAVALRYKRVGIILDMGLGKTFVSLVLAHHLRMPTIVVVDKAHIVHQWLGQAREHLPDLQIVGLTDDMKPLDKKMSVELFESGVLVMTYAMMSRLMSIPRKAKGRNKFFLDKEKAVEFAKRFRCVVLDESTMVRTRGSLFWNCCNVLSQTSEYFYILTGTPMAGNIHHAWSQSFLVDRGETFGKHLNVMRAAICKETRNHWSGFYEYELDRKHEEFVHRALRNRMICYSKEECTDLPARILTDVPLDMPAKVAKTYQQSVYDMRGLSSSQRDLSYQDLRRLASGVVTVDKDEGEWVSTFKLDAVLDDLSRVPEGCSTVITCDFVSTARLILAKLKAQARRVYGMFRGVKQVHKFLEGGPAILVATNKAIATGTNLQKANYMFVVEVPDDPIDWLQLLDRCHRIGTTKTVFVYAYTTRGTMEPRILKALQKGESFKKRVIAGSEQL